MLVGSQKNLLFFKRSEVSRIRAKKDLMANWLVRGGSGQPFTPSWDRGGAMRSLPSLLSNDNVKQAIPSTDVTDTRGIPIGKASVQHASYDWSF